MDVVIDSSAIIAVLLHEPERNDLIAATRPHALVTPGSTRWEIGNALVAGWRRKRLSLDEICEAWVSFDDILLSPVEVDVLRALRVAAEYGLYAYDAYVLEAARASRLPLLTLDGGLVRAAKLAEVPLLEV